MWTSAVNREAVNVLNIQADERVLDVGAGMGVAAVLAAQLGANVVAVDPTPFMRVVLGVRRLGQRARKRIEILDGAVEHLPVTDASIDAAWAINAMHHWADLDAGVSELRRVLRRGGRLLLVDEDLDDPGHPDRERIRARRRKQHLAFPDIDPAVVGSKFATAGLVVEEAGKTVLAGRPAKLIRATKV
jgi:ubiquinone/menaquinone biosynthesis C-methylase UbiE